MRKIIFLTLLLSGCTAHYVKPGASDQEFKKDFTDCQVKAGQAGFSPQFHWGKNPFLDQCMAGAGWERH